MGLPIGSAGQQAANHYKNNNGARYQEVKPSRRRSAESEPYQAPNYHASRSGPPATPWDHAQPTGYPGIYKYKDGLATGYRATVYDPNAVAGSYPTVQVVGVEKDGKVTWHQVDENGRWDKNKPGVLKYHGNTAYYEFPSQISRQGRDLSGVDEIKPLPADFNPQTPLVLPAGWQLIRQHGFDGLTQTVRIFPSTPSATVHQQTRFNGPINPFVVESKITPKQGPPQRSGKPYFDIQIHDPMTAGFTIVRFSAG